MGIINIVCKSLQIPSPPPQVTIPNFGVMQQAWGALDDIPDPAKLLGEMQNQLASAMAPVRRYLEIVEVLQAIQQCLKAAIDAVTQLSPDPLFDCFKNLTKAIARVLSWLPPLSYVRTAADIAGYCIDVMDEIFDFFERLDDMISDYISTLSNATLLNDSDLIGFANCGLSEVLPHIIVVVDLIAFVTPLNNALMDMFTRLMPNPLLQTIKQMYEETQTYVLKVQAQLKLDPTQPLPQFLTFPLPTTAQNPNVPVPKLGPLLEATNHCRNGMVLLYNFMAPVVGLDADKETRSTPTYTYL